MTRSPSRTWIVLALSLLCIPTTAAADPPVVQVTAGEEQRIHLDLGPTVSGPPHRAEIVIEQEPNSHGLSVTLASPRTGGADRGTGQATLTLQVDPGYPRGTRDGLLSFYDQEGVLVGQTELRLRVVGGLQTYASYALALVVALPAGLLAVLAANTVLHSRFLPPPKTLAQQMTALEWQPETRMWKRDPGSLRDPLPALQKALRPHRRLLAWLRANPLVFCLPGRRYQETLTLHLAPPFHASLRRDRDMKRRLREGGKELAGEVLAVATSRGGVRFAAVPDRQGRAGGLELVHRRTRDNPEDDVVYLSSTYRLVRRGRSQEIGGSGGWQLSSS